LESQNADNNNNNTDYSVQNAAGISQLFAITPEMTVYKLKLLLYLLSNEIQLVELS
jgi:hypothetical protein